MKQIVIVVLLVSTSSVFGADQEASRGLSDDYGRGSDCIWLRTVRDYTTLDDQNLLIRGAGKRDYLVTLMHRSFGLKSSIGLGFSSRDDQLCPYGGDALVFDGLNREEVGIRSISKVSPEQAEELLVRFGRKEPDEQQTPAPKALKGAEVEELD
ncbi:MAG: DUF6491 family protein [Woeseiaceae bacterium]